jgi:hypothetical protein
VFAVAYVLAGLLVGSYLPYPPSIFITLLASLTFMVVRTLLPGIGGNRAALWKLRS